MLTGILQDDVDALITNAHTWYKSTLGKMDRNGDIDMASAIRGTLDPDNLKRQTLANLKKAIAWLKKQERAPEPRAYNAGSQDLSRDIMAPFAQFSGAVQHLANTRPAKQLQDYFGPIGQGKRHLDESASGQEVLVKLDEFKRNIALTARWVNGVRL